MSLHTCWSFRGTNRLQQEEVFCRWALLVVRKFPLVGSIDVSCTLPDSSDAAHHTMLCALESPEANRRQTIEAYLRINHIKITLP